jgi:hypothetical protein
MKFLSFGDEKRMKIESSDIFLPRPGSFVKGKNSLRSLSQAARNQGGKMPARFLIRLMKELIGSPAGCFLPDRDSVQK